MAWHNWLIPHKQTHKKAHLISWEGLIIYILIFILLQVSFSLISYIKPGVLGIDSNIDQKFLISLTNVERKKQGLPELSENEALDKAAKLKAQNMFTENYWAHFAPSGKTPWDFMLGSGYKFSFAGENLAKNFYTSEDVVKAWMNSPTHKDNLLNPKYKDIGIAVVEGDLNGQKTTLIVQMFGTTEMLASNPTVEVQGKSITVPPQQMQKRIEMVPLLGESKVNSKVIDQYLISKLAGYSIIAIISVLLVLDIWVLKRRGVFRLSSHNVAHMAFLSVAAGSFYLANPGSVLSSNTGQLERIMDLGLKGITGIFGTNSNFAAYLLLTIGIMFYLIWALIYHKRDKSLTLIVLMEYLLTAVLVLILMTGMVF